MKSLFICLLIPVTFTTLLAQKLSGKVTNLYNSPISEVNIVNKNTNHHTHSDGNGQYVFENLSIGDTLEFSHIGFKKKEIAVKKLEKTLVTILTPNFLHLKEVNITPEINHQNLISNIDVKISPVKSSQEVLRKVPGLFIGQHAGGGKAEQIFLRGFDIDHGTDIAISVDGLPVNMVSHAHGQGYADLHFLIPETIDKIDFGKGSYYQDKGNFNTAGYVDFKTKNNLENSNITTELGQFNTYRLLTMLNLLKQQNKTAYVAAEFNATDGPFTSSQNFNRTNIFGNYSANINNTDKIKFTASYFNSQWDASGQIPQRAVDGGLISRFGAIDDTEGGKTSRNNITIQHIKKTTKNSSITNNLFFSKYDFELYSNFTFYLDDPINGDQIKQKETRTLYGANSVYNQKFKNEKIDGNWQVGIGLRNDKSKNNELSHTLNRSETLNILQLGNINETNLYTFVSTNINLNKWSFTPSLRLDYFSFNYNNSLETLYQTKTSTQNTVSPKFNIKYTPFNYLQFYLKTGKGFHTNDTRVVIEDQQENILPAAYSYDLGTLWKPNSKTLINIAYWSLYLEQEFVYVGDAGIVEPSGKTQRQGVELSYRYQPTHWLYWSLDANYTYARTIEENEYIPLAPDFTLVNGLNFTFKSGLYGSLNTRYLDDRPANEDNSIVAEGYTVTDFNIGYKWSQFNIGLQIQNLFDTEWNETQFATESKLFNETEAVEEIHFTPGTPLFIKTTFQYNF